ncbi:hypothetical protein Trydic_g2038 [Trypoxylus dichotomus]
MKTLPVIFALLFVTVEGYLAENQNMAIAKCIQKTGISESIVARMGATLEIPDTSIAKKFLMCLNKKMGFQDDEGQMLFDNLKEGLIGLTDTEECTSLTEQLTNGNQFFGTHEPKLEVSCSKRSAYMRRKGKKVKCQLSNMKVVTCFGSNQIGESSKIGGKLVKKYLTYCVRSCVVSAFAEMGLFFRKAMNQNTLQVYGKVSSEKQEVRTLVSMPCGLTGLIAH